MMVMDEDETQEAYANCMRVREQMRLVLQTATCEEKRFAIRAVGMAAKRICTMVERSVPVHEPTYETVMVRAEILGGGL